MALSGLQINRGNELGINAAFSFAKKMPVNLIAQQRRYERRK
jgi:hypothetical protein